MGHYLLVRLYLDLFSFGFYFAHADSPFSVKLPYITISMPQGNLDVSERYNLGWMPVVFNKIPVKRKQTTHTTHARRHARTHECSPPLSLSHTHTHTHTHTVCVCVSVCVFVRVCVTEYVRAGVCVCISCAASVCRRACV